MQSNRTAYRWYEIAGRRNVNGMLTFPPRGQRICSKIRFRRPPYLSQAG